MTLDFHKKTAKTANEEEFSLTRLEYFSFGRSVTVLDEKKGVSKRLYVKQGNITQRQIRLLGVKRDLASTLTN